MPATRTNWIVFITVTALVGSLWIGMTRVQASAINPTGRPPSPDLGHPAPDFTLDALEGDPITLSDLRGKPVLLNFWATWCPPCRAETPALEAASRQWAGRAVILGVDVQESRALVASFAADFGLTYPLVLDTSAEVAQMYRVRAFPTSYLLDDRGVVVEIFIGPVNQALIHTRLAALLAE